MANVFKDQKKFMKAGDQTVKGYNQEQFDMYVKLMDEEWNELKEAIAANDDIEKLDALIDFIVVTVGAIHSAGYDGENAWKEVMSTNFSKIDKETGKVRKREDGKILKPTGWVAPNLAKFV